MAASCGTDGTAFTAGRPAGKLKLIYAAHARIPSKMAHAYQISQMCEAFAYEGWDVELWRADYSPPRGLETNLFDRYGLQRVFSEKALPVLDLAAWLESCGIPCPGFVQRIAEKAGLLSYSCCLLLALRTRTESVVYCRDTIPLWLASVIWPKRASALYFEGHTAPLTRLGRFLRKQLARRIGGFIVITGELQKRYEGLGIRPERILAAHDGYSPARFKLQGDRMYWRRALNWPAETFVVGYAGRFQTMGMDKGLGVLADAVSQLEEDCSGRTTRLALVGGPEETVSALRVKLASRGLPEDFIWYPGMVAPAEVPKYLRAFDVCAMTFPWTEHFAYFASPLKLFEYMASGSPIVASNLPAVSEIIRHEQNGLLTAPSDAAAVAQALRRLRDDPELAVRLARRAEKDVRAFTWENRARSITRFIHGTHKFVPDDKTST